VLLKRGVTAVLLRPFAHEIGESHCMFWNISGIIFGLLGIAVAFLIGNFSQDLDKNKESNTCETLRNEH
jgi:hypothetical protein